MRLVGVIPLLAVVLYFAEPILKAATWTSVRMRRLAHANALLSTVVSRVGERDPSIGLFRSHQNDYILRKQHRKRSSPSLVGRWPLSGVDPRSCNTKENHVRIS
jgi:hypothetical protein